MTPSTPFSTTNSSTLMPPRRTHTTHHRTHMTRHDTRTFFALWRAYGVCLNINCRFPFPLYPRDFQCLEVYTKVDDETWLAIARSVDSGHVPTNEQYVRADLRASGYQIKAYARNTTLSHPHITTTRMFILLLSDRSVAGNPDACVVTYICECDPCGYLPKWAVNFDVDQPLVLAKYVQPTSFCALLARQSFSEPAHEPTVHFSINQDQAASGEGRQVLQQVRHARACPHPSTLAVHTFWSHFCSLT